MTLGLEPTAPLIWLASLEPTPSPNGEMAGSHPLRRAEALVLVAIGGFLGANVRYLLGLAVPGLGGTLLANVTGSALLGFVLYEATLTGLLAAETRLVVATGFLSSYTTYSTFALETIRATPLLGIANVLASYALGFGAVYIGGYAAGLLEER
jgi:CrcB protein